MLPNIFLALPQRRVETQSVGMKMHAQKNPPDLVYKFLDVNGGLASLKPNNLTVHYTCAADFNDPFECLIRGFSEASKQEFVQRAMEASEDDSVWDLFWTVVPFMPKDPSESAKLRGNQALLQEFINQVTQQSASHLKKSLPSFPYISCFSEDKRWIPMWSHYAEDHKGIVIGYASKYLPRLRKVQDRSTRIKLRLTPDKTRKWVENLVLTKFAAWHHECEWRSFLPMGFPRNLPVSPEAIVEINMGIRTDSKLWTACHAFVTEHPACRLYQAEPHETKFAIKFAAVKVQAKQMGP